MLRLKTEIGRLWTREEEARGQRDGAVLGYAFWRQQFNRDPNVLGKPIVVGTRSYQVIGVLAASTDVPEVGMNSAPIWVPQWLDSTTPANARVAGRKAGRHRDRHRAAGWLRFSIGPMWWYGSGMVKVTYTLDRETVAAIKRTAERLGTPQSHVVREAVAEYAARTDRLSERERLRMLGVLDGLRGAPITRTAAQVDAELRAIRAARRRGGRRSRA